TRRCPQLARAPRRWPLQRADDALLPRTRRRLRRRRPRRADGVLRRDHWPERRRRSKRPPLPLLGAARESVAALAGVERTRLRSWAATGTGRSGAAARAEGNLRTGEQSVTCRGTGFRFTATNERDPNQRVRHGSRYLRRGAGGAGLGALQRLRYFERRTIA